MNHQQRYWQEYWKANRERILEQKRKRKKENPLKAAENQARYWVRRYLELLQEVSDDGNTGT